MSSCLGFSVSRGFEKANKKYKSNKKNWTGFLSNPIKKSCDIWHIYIHTGISFHHKNEEILPFVIIYMDLEVIMLSKISQVNTV